MNTQEIKKEVAHQLSLQGFTAYDPIAFSATTAVSYKNYDTAAGKRQAGIYLMEIKEDYHLSGEFWSEGRNVLSTTWGDLAKGISKEERHLIILKFLISVEKEINKSYARKLYLGGYVSSLNV